ncbi:MAG: hypothetical protein V1770_05650 [bacterium]
MMNIRTMNLEAKIILKTVESAVENNMLITPAMLIRNIKMFIHKYEIKYFFAAVKDSFREISSPVFFLFIKYTSAICWRIENKTITIVIKNIIKAVIIIIPIFSKSPSFGIIFSSSSCKIRIGIRAARVITRIFFIFFLKKL